MSENCSNWPRRQTVNFIDLLPEQKQLAIDAIRVFEPLRSFYNLNIFVPGNENYTLQGSTSVIIHSGTDQQMTIAKTWFGDNGIYICVRADIHETPLKSKEGEYECRLGIYDHDEPFVCKHINNVSEGFVWIASRVIPVLNVMKKTTNGDA